MDKKLSSLRKKITAVRVKFKQQNEKLKYYKNSNASSNKKHTQGSNTKKKSNKTLDIFLLQPPHVVKSMEDDGTETIVIMDNAHSGRNLKNSKNNDISLNVSQKLPAPSSTSTNLTRGPFPLNYELSMNELYNHLDYYLKEIEERSMLKFVGNASPIERKSSLSTFKFKSTARNPLPTRPSSASPIRRRRKMFGKKAKKISATTADLKLKRKVYKTQYVLNHRDNVGKGILNGGYYHVVNGAF